MALPSLPYNMQGNNIQVDSVQLGFNVVTNVPIAAANQPYIVAGTGVPSFTAPKGTVYIRLDGAAATMLYVNNNGATTWSVVTSA